MGPESFSSFVVPGPPGMMVYPKIRGQKGEQLRPVAIETAAYPLPNVLFMPGGGLLNIRDMLRGLHGRYLTAGDGI